MTELDKALKSINSSARSLQNELKKVDAALEFEPDDYSLLTHKFKLLSEAVKSAADRVDALSQADEELEKQLEDGKLSQGQYDAFRRELLYAEQNLRKAKKALKEFIEQQDGVAEESDDAAREVEDFADKVEDLTDAVEDSGEKSDDAAREVDDLADKVEDSGIKADTASGKFGKFALSVASAVSKATLEAIAAVGTGLVTAGTAAVKAGVEYESAFAGVKKTVDATIEELDALDEGIREMSKNKPTTAVDIAAVAEAAGQLGIATENIIDFTGVMIDLGEATNLTADEAASALAKFANITQMDTSDYERLGSTIVGLGNNFATTEADIVSMATRLASTGELVGLSEAEIMAVATALSSVGIEAEAGGSAISKAMKNIEVAVETNSKSLEKYADVAGMTSEEFKTAWQENAVGALSSFIDGLGKLDESGESAAKVLDEMNLKEIRLSNALLSLSTSGGILTEAVDLANAAWEENTALSNEAEQRYATLESRFGMLKNTVTDLGISFKESINDELGSALDYATEKADDLAEAFKEGGIEGFIDELGDVVSDVAAQLVDKLPMIVDAAADIVIKLAETIIDTLPELAEPAADIVITLAEAILENLPEIVDAALKIIVTLAEALGEALPELIPAAVDAIVQIVDTLIDNIDLLIDAAIAIILGLTEGLIESIPILIDAVPEIVEKLVIAIIENSGKLMGAAYELIYALIGGLLENLPDLLMVTADICQAIVDGIINTDWVGVALDMIEGFANGLVKGVAAVKEAVDNICKRVTEYFSKFSLKDVGKNIIEGLVNGFADAGNTLKNGIFSIGAKVLDGFKDIFGIASPSKVFRDEVGKYLADGIGVGFTDEMRKVTKDMTDALDTDFKTSIDIGSAAMYGGGITPINVTLPFMIDGKKVAQAVSTIQYDNYTRKARVMGVAVT